MKAQCIICTDLFEDDSTISALLCGHTFHESCVKEWCVTNGQRNCPQCRDYVNFSKIVPKLYFSSPDPNETGVFGEDTARLENELAQTKLLVDAKEKEKQEAITKKLLAEQLTEAGENKYLVLQQLLAEKKRECKEQSAKLKILKTQMKEKDLIVQENKRLANRMRTYEHVEKVMRGVEVDEEEMMSYGTGPDAVRQCIMLQKMQQKAIKEGKEMKRTLQNSLLDVKRKYNQKKIELEKENSAREDALETLKRESEENRVLYDLNKVLQRRLEEKAKEPARVARDDVQRCSSSVSDGALNTAFLQEQDRTQGVMSPPSTSESSSENEAPTLRGSASANETIDLTEDSPCYDRNRLSSSSSSSDDDLNVLSVNLIVGTKTAAKAASNKQECAAGCSWNILNKKSTFGSHLKRKTCTGDASSSSFSSIRVGYDGIGGHAREVVSHASKRTASRLCPPKISSPASWVLSVSKPSKNGGTKTKIRKTDAMPALPSMKF